MTPRTQATARRGIAAALALTLALTLAWVSPAQASDETAAEETPAAVTTTTPVEPEVVEDSTPEPEATPPSEGEPTDEAKPTGPAEESSEQKAEAAPDPEPEAGEQAGAEEAVRPNQSARTSDLTASGVDLSLPNVMPDRPPVSPEDALTLATPTHDDIQESGTPPDWWSNWYWPADGRYMEPGSEIAVTLQLPDIFFEYLQQDLDSRCGGFESYRESLERELQDYKDWLAEYPDDNWIQQQIDWIQEQIDRLPEELQQCVDRVLEEWPRDSNFMWTANWSTNTVYWSPIDGTPGDYDPPGQANGYHEITEDEFDQLLTGVKVTIYTGFLAPANATLNLYSDLGYFGVDATNYWSLFTPESGSRVRFVELTKPETTHPLGPTGYVDASYTYPPIPVCDGAWMGFSPWGPGSSPGDNYATHWNRDGHEIVASTVVGLGGAKNGTAVWPASSVTQPVFEALGCQVGGPEPVTASIYAATLVSGYLDWEVHKSADKASVTVAPGEAAEIEYTVTVDPNWRPRTPGQGTVHGFVTVENPNGTPASANVTVTVPNGTCTVSSNPVSVPAGGTAIGNYSCTVNGVTEATSGTVSASVAWTVGGASDTAAAEGAFDFADAEASDPEGLPRVWLSDTAPEFSLAHPGGDAHGLPVWVGPWTEGVTFTYSRQLGAGLAAGQCESYANTATLRWDYHDPGGPFVVSRAHADVEVCALADPALTIEKAAAIAPGSILASGTEVTWTYTATNTGNVDLAGIEVTDDRKLDGPVCTVASLPVGASETCTWTGPVYATALALPGGGP